ncbi:MAG: putative toxin-antitoxin system toxin component, PIN family [Schwartzia sp.]|nr:putative toxin-antitoxin system toxin component, PIN family [Schwartzia sp. (in: firmicutes)]
MLDTNVLVSAILFPSANTEQFLQAVTEHHHVILCDYVMDELWKVIHAKFPHKVHAAKVFLQAFQYEVIPSPKVWDKSTVPDIRDANDAAILATAILEKADIIVTGDKDFLVLALPEPKIMTMAEFVAAYSAQ